MTSTAWKPRRKAPFARSVAAVLGRDRIFLANTHYGAVKQGSGGNLACAHMVGGEWKQDTLESEGVTDAALTACRDLGNTVFCFYVEVVKKGDGNINEVHHRRWKAGTWEPSVLVAAEAFAVNHVTVPIVCPADYAAVFWDQRKTRAMRHKPNALRFVRVLNR